MIYFYDSRQVVTHDTGYKIEIILFIALCLIQKSKKGISRIKATKVIRVNFVAFMSIYKY
ncbi:MAG: hypothetical protein K0R69_1808 [Clostridia bacterium]|jgi:hypothetical protein|nr:hypothetical protein [Clostridia bacterium]